MINQDVLDNPVVRSYDDFVNLTVIEDTDMTVTSIKRIAMRYPKDTLNKVRGKVGSSDFWVVKEIGRNSSGRIIYVKTISESPLKPEWVPALYV